MFDINSHIIIKMYGSFSKIIISKLKACNTKQYINIWHLISFMTQPSHVNFSFSANRKLTFIYYIMQCSKHEHKNQKFRLPKRKNFIAWQYWHKDRNICNKWKVKMPANPYRQISVKYTAYNKTSFSAPLDFEYVLYSVWKAINTYNWAVLKIPLLPIINNNEKSVYF